jgi:hypothetical protein
MKKIRFGMAVALVFAVLLGCISCDNGSTGRRGCSASGTCDTTGSFGNSCGEINCAAERGRATCDC